MFDSIINFFKKFSKENKDSKDTAKERLHLVLMQDRANVSADFLEMMKQEIIEVIKKYIDVDENSIDVKLTNKVNTDGTTGAPALYANIPIMSLKDETKKVNIERKKEANNENKETQQNEEIIDNKDKKIKVNAQINEEIEEVIQKDEKEQEKKEDDKNDKLEETQKEQENEKELENNQEESSNEENKKEENNQIENKEAKSEEPNEEKKEE